MMEALNVLAAAFASYVFGAVWYMVQAKPWAEAHGIELDATGKPVENAGALPYVIAFVGAVLVAGMMRHIFSLSGIEGVGKGLVSGLGIGLFIAAPWMASNIAFTGKPLKLIWIDGGYPLFGCAIIGFVLALF